MDKMFLRKYVISIIPVCWGAGAGAGAGGAGLVVVIAAVFVLT